MDSETTKDIQQEVICVVIPAYRVAAQILSVIDSITDSVSSIIVVDDKCPEHSGKIVEEQCKDPRVIVIYHSKNLGVGGATISGYKHALKENVDIIVKIDGDGQMNPSELHRLVHPIIAGHADYSKGNRFFRPDFLRQMPTVRLAGNVVCSFLSKACSGYWNIMDSNNGYTAIHATCLSWINLNKVEQRYFFESDMLFRLGILRAVVCDVPLVAVYGDETSNLSPLVSAFQFSGQYANKFIKRIAYAYFIRDFNISSIQLIVGTICLFSGSLFGAYHWHLSIAENQPATAGTVMIATLLIILGFQLLMSVINFDLANTPRTPIHLWLAKK